MNTEVPSEGSNRRTRRRLALVLGSLLVLGAAAALALTANSQAQGEATTRSVVALPLTAVKTAPVTEGEAPISLRLPGTLRGERETDLAANATGQVVSTAVERGSQVRQGQVIAVLDVSGARLVVEQSRAEAARVRVQQQQAQIECDRMAKLKADGVVSDAEYQQHTTPCGTLPLSLAAASAQANLASKTVADGVIRAPFAGVVTERYVEVGQYLRPESRVVTLITEDPLRLEFAIPEADIAQVRTGMAVSFGVSAFPGRTHRATVRFISGAVRAATRDLMVEAVVDNSERRLKAGMFADVQIVTGTRKLPRVPQQAVFERDGQPHAFFVVHNRLEERVVALGPALGQDVSIEKGAQVGEMVVVDDHEALSNGADVTHFTPEPANTSP